MLRLAFYKAQYGGVWAKLISLWSHGPYSHVELVFTTLPTNHPSVPIVQHDPNGTLCFSSAEGDNGTRFKILDMTDGKWDFVDVPGADEFHVFKLATTLLGKKYDWNGILGFVFPWEKGNTDKYFCSEIAIILLQTQGFLQKEPQHTSPVQLYKDITANGLK